MYLLVYQIVPGIILGFVLPFDGDGLFPIMLFTVAGYAVITMIIELVSGRAKARSWRSRLAAELDADEDSEVVALAVLRASITHQFIYKFHLPAFVIGCLALALPVALVSLITYGLRRWLA
jgi:hypothetical protein